MRRQKAKQSPIADSNPYSPISEAYRVLRTHLQLHDGGESPMQIMTAASAQQGEGKTTTLVNMAVVFAQEGKRVALIDGDLRRPSIHEHFHLPNDRGLSSYLGLPFELEDVVRATSVANLDVIPSGPIPKNPSELLSSDRMELLLTTLRGAYDIILIDTPPLLMVSDGKVIAAKCDGTVLVVHAKKSKRKLVKKAKEQLERINANVLGVVLNGKSGQEAKGLYAYGNVSG